uniref:WD repeat-containing protein on Y chromosome-like n=1 Tax=Scatophagus argus TaxID=75038 RepID=UPI001ED819B1|nr:WD repeat-containing protein on Y chromosome-like [Scatophagus argus]
MEIHKDKAEGLPKTTGTMFGAEDIPKIEELFRANAGEGLNMEEFCAAMKKVYGDSVSEEEFKVLHMKINSNCAKKVAFADLLSYLFNKNIAMESMDYKDQPFQKSFKNIRVHSHEPILRLLFQPHKDDMDSESSKGQIKPYQKGQYLSVTSHGMLTVWTESFKKTSKFDLNKTQNKIPFSSKKMYVNDMVYIKELQQLAVSCKREEVLFFNCSDFQDISGISHALIIEEHKVNTMNYWSNGKKALFSFGDVKGFLSVFISYDVKANGLFCRKAYKKISLKRYPTVYVSALLKQSSENFLCIKVPIFDDICSQIQYFPTLDSYALCGSSSKTMVMVSLPKSSDTQVSKTVFKSSRYCNFFTCVEYSPSAECLLTGGTDGLLRVWFPHKSPFCKRTLTGHIKPITHIMFNSRERMFVSLSQDKNVRVWAENGWYCLQSIQAQDIGHTPISSVYYNIHNNELVLAHSDIATCMGRGTDVFQNTLTSHDKPLCSALYHSDFKQVISVCQNGVVTVWDILTGKVDMRFKVTPEYYVGFTAMAFDGAQRRLITVSQDRKVRLWNFNNGTELGVLPVIVPKEVTGIVCLNNRVFVSGKNSKIILDLDLKGYHNRFLKHDYLDDILSMDVHQTTLVTASSNGNIVIWDASEAKAVYWLNASMSPQIQLAGKGAQTGSLPVESSQKNVRGTKRRGIQKHLQSAALTNTMTDSNIRPLVMCLKTRKVKGDTATLLTSADGYIYAWSVIKNGGLLAKFRAVNDEGAVITTMSTDVKEHVLLAGDSTGRVYMWDIQEFGFARQVDKGASEVINGRRVSLCSPPLLSTWQSHLTKVVSIKCDPVCENVITAGLDCKVRLWTNTGCCTGLFGKDKWDAMQPTSKENADQEQTGGPATAENSETPFPKSPSPPRNYDKLLQRTDLALKPKVPLRVLLARGRELLKPEFAQDKVNLKNIKSQFKVHPPQTRPITRGTDPTQSSPQKAHFPQSNQVRCKFGRVLKFPQKDTLKGSVLIPQPPDTPPGKHLYFPPIPRRVQLTGHQAQFRQSQPQKY